MDIQKNKNQSNRQKQKHASYFDFQIKRQKELGILEDLLNSMDIAGERLYTFPRLSEKDPPDCIVNNLDSELVGVEITEFVYEEAVAKAQRGEYKYKFWTNEELLELLEAILREKDKKTYLGGPFAQIVVVIHTDESTLTFTDKSEIIRNLVVSDLHQINKAYVLFSFDPNFNRCPYIRLDFGNRSSLSTDA